MTADRKAPIRTFLDPRVEIYAPTGSFPFYRILGYRKDGKRAINTSGGRTIRAAKAKAQKVSRQLKLTAEPAAAAGNTARVHAAMTRLRRHVAEDADANDADDWLHLATVSTFDRLSIHARIGLGATELRDHLGQRVIEPFRQGVWSRDRRPTRHRYRYRSVTRQRLRATPRRRPHHH
jgi:hypothetical protein